MTVADTVPGSADIAQSFVRARLAGRATPDYPGRIPRTMAEAYAVQDAAIALFPDVIVGWKVGGVPQDQQDDLGVHRVAGPIFSGHLWDDDGANRLPAIQGGFAAIEAEFVARIGPDVDPAKTDWSLQQAHDAVDAIFIGVELAGSPLAAINDLGSAVVASDFGNNAGLLLGARLDDWRNRMDRIAVETRIDGVAVGAGGAPSLAGGAIESVRFALEHCARRGRPLVQGILISTGAVTGVHRIYSGSDFVCDFQQVGKITGSVVNAEI